mmetsp:Transcript_29860/g.69458  ORF Transcript_29860/g.69458 Transcript_29860/m.69458 type:complete len:237 (+) Transcript_29860:408-1118(+)
MCVPPGGVSLCQRSGREFDVAEIGKLLDPCIEESLRKNNLFLTPPSRALWLIPLPDEFKSPDDFPTLSLFCRSFLDMPTLFFVKSATDRMETTAASKSFVTSFSMRSGAKPDHISLKEAILTAGSSETSMLCDTETFGASVSQGVRPASFCISIKRRWFSSSCILAPSMSFGSLPKGFSISMAMKLRAHKMKTWMMTKMKAQAAEVTHWETTKGTTSQCSASKQSQACAYGKGNGM